MFPVSRKLTAHAVAGIPVKTAFYRGFRLDQRLQNLVIEAETRFLPGEIPLIEKVIRRLGGFLTIRQPHRLYAMLPTRQSFSIREAT